MWGASEQAWEGFDQKIRSAYDRKDKAELENIYKQVQSSRELNYNYRERLECHIESRLNRL